MLVDVLEALSKRLKVQSYAQRKFLSTVNLKKYQNRKGEIWLNIASSTYSLKDYVNLENHIYLSVLNVFPILKYFLPERYRTRIQTYYDIRNKDGLERFDCSKKLFFPDNSVDHVLCSHFLEHLRPYEVEKVLRDYYRVLKNNGTIHIILPDIKFQVDRYIKEKDTIPDAADRFIRNTLLVRDTKRSMVRRILDLFASPHYWMYDYSSISIRIKKAGFTILSQNLTPSKHYREKNDVSIHIAAIKDSA